LTQFYKERARFAGKPDLTLIDPLKMVGRSGFASLEKRDYRFGGT